MQQKSEFRNDSEGQLGVVVIDNGKERGIAVAPGRTIWLSEDEQVLTANAPRREQDNPFINGNLTLITEASEVGNRRPIGTSAPEPEPEPENSEPESEPSEDEADPKQAQAEAKKQADAKRAARAKKQAEAGARPTDGPEADIGPSGHVRTGKRAAGEEVATPEAATAAAE